MTLDECIQEIKKASGWSQERISAETGLEANTISRVLRVPNYKANETSRNLVRHLQEGDSKSPFPASLEYLITLYDIWKECYSQKDFITLINILELLLQHHNALVESGFAACRVRWLLGHIYFDRAFYLRINIPGNAEQSMKEYEKALSLLENRREDGLALWKYKLQQCIAAIKFNGYSSENRPDNQEIKDWLANINYLEIVSAVVKEDKKNWMAARNGLIAASILQDRVFCGLFWETMRKADIRFVDPDFIPSSGLPPISREPDLEWFAANFILPAK